MSTLDTRYHDAAGTVSIATGDTAATGTGTAWNITARAGDLLLIGGVAGLVAEVTSATRLTLLTPWPGPNVANAACALLFTSPSRYDALEMPAAIARLIDAGRAAAARAETYAVIAVLDAPPTAPVLDDMYLVAATPSGGWIGRAGHLAQWSGGGWLYIAPRAGLWAHDLATGALLACTGTAWRPLIETISAALAEAVTATRASATSATASASEASAGKAAAALSATQAATSATGAAASAATASTRAGEASASAASAAASASVAAGVGYSMSICNEAGVPAGIYYLCPIRHAGPYAWLRAEVISGSTGASVSFRVLIGDIPIVARQTVVLGTPLTLTGLALAVPAGARIDIEITRVTGAVEFFLEIAR